MTTPETTPPVSVNGVLCGTYIEFRQALEAPPESSTQSAWRSWFGNSLHRDPQTHRYLAVEGLPRTLRPAFDAEPDPEADHQLESRYIGRNAEVAGWIAVTTQEADGSSRVRWRQRRPPTAGMDEITTRHLRARIPLQSALTHEWERVPQRESAIGCPRCPESESSSLSVEPAPDGFDRCQSCGGPWHADGRRDDGEDYDGGDDREWEEDEPGTWYADGRSMSQEEELARRFTREYSVSVPGSDARVPGGAWVSESRARTREAALVLLANKYNRGLGTVAGRRTAEWLAYRSDHWRGYYLLGAIGIHRALAEMPQ